MQYTYHCQHQAEAFARTILPVPGDYPLQKGLPEDFRQQFAGLCDLAKNMYLDMAKAPENYGLKLVDIDSQDHNLARDGYHTLHRLVDTLSALFASGELKNHQLTVSAEAFRTLIKKGRGAVSGPVPKYELILSRLSDFGFVCSDFAGKPYGAKIDSFTVEYPDNPEMMDTLEIYFACWDAVKDDRADVRIAPKEFHHRYYRFDYKITADRAAIPMRQWVKDDSEQYSAQPAVKAFAVAFYDHSLQYSGLKFDGDFYYKSKRIARVTETSYSALGKPAVKLSIKLGKPDKSMDAIRAMPASIQAQFMRDTCGGFCGRPEGQPCKHWLHWTYDGQAHTGCPWFCFFFDDFDLERVPDYWRILETQYGLKRV